MPNYSVIQYAGISGGHCGYCGGRNKKNLGKPEESGEEIEDDDNSISLGVFTDTLDARHYQNYLNCGWRRSGTYMYKPTMDKTCCPQYTIRLDTTKFYLSRSQRRVLNQMNQYLKDDKKPKSTIKEELDPIDENVSKRDSNISDTTDTKTTKELTKKQKEAGDITKKKVMRRKRCIDKWVQNGLDVEQMQQKRKDKETARRRTVESFLIREEKQQGWKHRLEVRLVKTDSEEFKTRSVESFQLFKKYQELIHNDPDKSLSGYTNFLVDTPLDDDDDDDDDDDRDETIAPLFGSYHQWYLLDDRLIAVGVIDILPLCVSSKYMFYDPDYTFLSLGTYTALREIQFTQQLQRTREELKYYYMGYYIETCKKMRYKGSFKPSDLLCDHSLTWVPLSVCRPLLIANDGLFTIFCPNLPAARRLTRAQLKVIFNNTVYPYTLLKEESSEDTRLRSIIDSYLNCVIPQLSDVVVYFDEIAR